MLDLNSHIANEWSHLKEKNIYVSCSAGVDSTVLAWALKRSNFKVTIIHINYQLRGKDSDLDALFLKSFCHEEKITFMQKIINLQDELNDGGNLQEVARNKRYEWFKHIIGVNSNNYIALGHHQDDQIETFFLNIIRKSGIMGLSCMLKEHNNIIRPLLYFYKNQIIEFAKANKIEWREDKSNTSNKYRRNLLRNVLLPKIKSENININKSILTLITFFQKTQKELTNKITPLIEDFIIKDFIKIEEIQKLNDFERIEFLRQLDKPKKYNNELLKLCETQKGKKIKWGNNWLINEGDILVEHKENEEEQNLKFSIEHTYSLPMKFNKNVIYLDSNKIYGNLKLRKWNIGDRIYPIGMTGSKLISDIISDSKLIKAKKDSIVVLHDDKNIHWCIGLTIGRKAIAEKNSKKILKITLS